MVQVVPSLKKIVLTHMGMCPRRWKGIFAIHYQSTVVAIALDLNNAILLICQRHIVIMSIPIHSLGLARLVNIWILLQNLFNMSMTIPISDHTHLLLPI